MAEFKVGDRVRVITGDWVGCSIGETGTVVSTNGAIGIKFDCYNSWRHDCEGKTPSGYGYYVRKNEIELIAENQFSIGDTVKIVSKGSKGKPYNETIGKIGVIDRTCMDENNNLFYGVKISNLTNPYSQYDCFWFEEDCLERFASEVKPLPEKYVIHTKTQEEADYLSECGVFSNGSLATWTSPYWEANKEESAYCVVGNNLMGFADIGFYEERTDRYGEIIEFDEWLARIGLNDNKINTKENNMRFIRDMQVEVTEVYEINKKDNTKDKYMITTVSTPLGKASVKCADKDYNKDEGVFLACAKITANQNEETMMLWHIAMDTWGSKTSMSILSRLADRACIGGFDKTYRHYLKEKELEYKKSCICKTCGTKFETPELAREHEKWHVDHKKEKYEAYLIRKEAKKRIAEAEREGKIETLMSEIFAKKN